MPRRGINQRFKPTLSTALTAWGIRRRCCQPIEIKNAAQPNSNDFKKKIGLKSQQDPGCLAIGRAKNKRHQPLARGKYRRREDEPDPAKQEHELPLSRSQQRGMFVPDF